MALQVAGEAVGDIVALTHNGHLLWHMSADAVEEQWEMGAAEDDAVDERIGLHELVDTFAHKIVGTGRVGFAGFDDGCPERTGLAGDGDVGKEFMDFEVVAAATDSALGGKDADVAAFGDMADGFYGGPDDTEHPMVGRRQVVLLDGAQGLCRCGVAAEDDQSASLTEEIVDGLSRELTDNVERTGTIGCTGIIAQIQIVVAGQAAADGVKDGQAAVARVEYSNGSHEDLMENGELIIMITPA